MATARAPAPPGCSAPSASRAPPFGAARLSLGGVASLPLGTGLRSSPSSAALAAPARVSRAPVPARAARAAAFSAGPPAPRVGSRGLSRRFPGGLGGLSGRPRVGRVCARAPHELFSVDDGIDGEDGDVSVGAVEGEDAESVSSSSSSSSSSDGIPTVSVAIIGSGPAGHTAAIYAGRACLSPHVFEGYSVGGPPGGQLTTTTEVENFPGFPEGVQGPELMDRMRSQAARWGAVLLPEDVSRVDWSSRPFLIEGEETSVRAHAVVVATGARARMLGIPGERAYLNRGVSACAICDGASPIFRGGRVAVVGGGDSACEEALYLTKYASEVHLLVRKHALRASGAMAERVLRHPKIRVRFGVRAERALGQDQVAEWRGRLATGNGALLESETSNEASGDGAGGVDAASAVAYNDEEAPPAVPSDVLGALVLVGAQEAETDASGAETRRVSIEAFDGLFYGIGHAPNTSLLREGGPALDEEGYVLTRDGPFTSLEGVFAAGDVQDTRWRQAITAAGSGCMAALAAERWLSERGLLPERAQGMAESAEGGEGETAEREEVARAAERGHQGGVGDEVAGERAESAADAVKVKGTSPDGGKVDENDADDTKTNAASSTPPPLRGRSAETSRSPSSGPSSSRSSSPSSSRPAFDAGETFFEGEYALRRLYHESPSPLVVLYASPTCAPCRMLKPILRSTVQGIGGRVKMVVVDIEATPHLARAAGVTSTPTVQIFKHKSLITQIVGVKPKKYYREAFLAAAEDREMAV